MQKKNKLEIKLSGLLAIPVFSIKNDKNNIYKTFITQEMLKKGFIVNNAVYISIAHNRKIFKRFFLALDSIFGLIKKYNSHKKIRQQLYGRESNSSFKRLN